MAPLDMLRIVLGLGIPTLLIGHAVGTRLAWELYQQAPQYARVVWSLWASDGRGRQLALLVPGWLHGCLGVHLAFAQRPLYLRAHRWLFAAALMLSVLAGLGFLAMGRDLAADLSNRAHLDAAIALRPSSAVLIGVREVLLAVYFSAIAAVFAAREIGRYSNGAHRDPHPVPTANGARTARQGACSRRAQLIIWGIFALRRAGTLLDLPCPGDPRRGPMSATRAQGTGDSRADPGRLGRAARLPAATAGDIAIVPLLGPRHRASDEYAQLDSRRAGRIALVWVDWRNRGAIAHQLLPQDAVFLSKLFSETVVLTVDAAGGTECDPSAGSTVAAFGYRRRPACRVPQRLVGGTQHRPRAGLSGRPMEERVRRGPGLCLVRPCGPGCDW
jgi:adenylate cyclase